MKKTENNQFLFQLNVLYNDLCAQIQSKSKKGRQETYVLAQLVKYISFHKEEVFSLSRTDLCMVLNALKLARSEHIASKYFDGMDDYFPVLEENYKNYR